MTTKETVLQRLMDSKLVINRSDGERWILQVKIPSCGKKTAAQLILEGHTDALLNYIEHLAEGGYA